MPYTVHQAKTNLSRLIEEACSGKEVIIARGKKPVVKLVPVEEPTKKRVPGEWIDKVTYTPDVFDPLTDDELRELGFIE
jgi:prevent-host-death family protein